MIEIRLTDFNKGVKQVHVDGYTTKSGVHVKDHYKKVKTGDHDVPCDTVNYREACKITGAWVDATPDIKEAADDVYAYTEFDSKSINKALRDSDIESIESFKTKINNVSKFIKNAPKFEGTVYRGMSFNVWGDNKSAEEYYKFISDVKNCDTITLKTFTSTSISENLASEFTIKNKNRGEPGGIILEIRSKNGVALDGASHYEVEREILFDRDTEFKVISHVIDFDTKMDRIVLEEK